MIYFPDVGHHRQIQSSLWNWDWTNTAWRRQRMNVQTRTLFGTCSPAAHIKAFCSGCWVEYVLAANKRSLYISEQCLRSIQVWEQIIFRYRFVYINTSSVTRGRPRRHRVISAFAWLSFLFSKLGAVVLSLAGKPQLRQILQGTKKQRIEGNVRFHYGTCWQKESINSLSSSS